MSAFDSVLTLNCSTYTALSKKQRLLTVVGSSAAVRVGIGFETFCPRVVVIAAIVRRIAATDILAYLRQTLEIGRSRRKNMSTKERNRIFYRKNQTIP
jgi:hypothetical protein